ncbi:hypothetical protein GE061_007237 [Apolygus lucorum]|uniref:Odorant receptor n=1 Tax=Apolygus lucorum TaxID=248454 RepID=A0A8S9WR55_APOLU|nr:hypothetical protein GE061_007237 [Apolygus lucorum]
MTFGIVAAVGYILNVSTTDEWDKFLENIHITLLIVNMEAQGVAYHYDQNGYIEIWRAIDKGFFDYEGTLDEETDEEIAIMKSELRNFKKVFQHNYTMLMCITTVLQFSKKPITRYLIGGGTVDGKNNLIWEAPFGLYFPFADYWIPYLLGLFLGNACGLLILITALGSVLQYIYISEALIQEFAVVKKTMSKCIERAEQIYRNRSNSNQVEHQQWTMDDCIIHCINQSVKHHQITLRMMNVFKKLMYFSLFAIIFDGGLILCISSYILINDEVGITFRLPMPCVIAVEASLALVFCYYGGKLTDANTDVGNGIYECKRWMDHSKILCPYALIVKSYCNVPNELSAAGFTNVDVRTWGNLLSTAYSYIGFLLST